MTEPSDELVEAMCKAFYYMPNATWLEHELCPMRAAARVCIEWMERPVPDTGSSQTPRTTLTEEQFEANFDLMVQVTNYYSKGNNIHSYQTAINAARRAFGLPETKP